MGDDWVEVEIELPNEMWDVLHRLAKVNGITIDNLVNDILTKELDMMDELKKSNSI